MAEQAKYSIYTAPGDGIKTVWDFNFAGAAGTYGYINRDHIFVYRTNRINKVITTLTAEWVGPNTLKIVPPVPVTDDITIKRITPKVSPLVDYTSGSLLNEKNLDTSNRQAIYAVAELVDAASTSGDGSLTESVAFEALTKSNQAISDAAGISSGRVPVNYNTAFGLTQDLAAKARRWTDVTDAGAKGDGIADDWDAIQAVLNSGIGLVVLPKGIYRISKPLKVPLRTSIRGWGGMVSMIYASNCDGLVFEQSGFEQDSSHFTDFSIWGRAGDNYTAINSPEGTGVKYGLHFDRVVISDFNQGFSLMNNLHCTITRCHLEFVNIPWTLGDTSTLTRIYGNTAISAGGSTHGGTAPLIGMNIIGGSNCEAVKVRDNLIFGYQSGIRVGTVTDLQIETNGIDACSRYCIEFTALQYSCNIKNNFLELIGASSVACIFGAPLGSGEYLSQINIEGNSFTSLSPLSIGSTGILFNTTVDTFQWHGRIVGNLFVNMTKNDICINLPGEMVIENNRLMSNLTNSMWLGAVAKAPVFIDKNWMKGKLYLDGANDVLTGKIILGHNTTNGTFVPYSGVFAPTYTCDSGAFGSITYGVQTGTWTRDGDIVHFAITMHTTAVALGTAGGILRIGGLPVPARASGAATIADSRAFTRNPILAQIAGSGIALATRATFNGDQTFLTPADLAATGTANVLTLSGSYIAAVGS